MTRTAWITLRHQPPYRSDAFANGFEDLGFKVRLQFPGSGMVKPGDVVVTWNLNPRYRDAAWEAKKSKAALLVAENGYVPRRGSAEPFYALARDGHNGSGFWYVGAEDRWASLDQPLADWNFKEDGYVLVADQRGIGSEIMRCPKPFYERIAPKIQRIFARRDKKHVPEVRLRAHPGRHQSKLTLAQELKGARALVTWASNAANEALLMGVPAFRAAPYHVNDAVLSDLAKLVDYPYPDRLAAFQNLAWAQWSLSEIENGTAFKHLLRDVL